MMLPSQGRVLIVGAGMTGYACATTLRKLGFTGDVALFGDEPHLPYDRPALSKRLLAEAAAPAFLSSREALQAQNIAFHCGKAAVAIERGERCLSLSDGSVLNYDALVLAMGGRARRLPASIDTPQLSYLRSLDDALAVSQKLEAAKRLAIIGGGWIGLEVAAAAAERGIRATIMEGQDFLCARSAPPFLSDALMDFHSSRGVSVLTRAAVSAIRALPQGGMAVELEDGRKVLADEVLAGIGLQPNDEVAARAGLDVGQGVRVDQAGRTSDPFIFAGGDVACVSSQSGKAARVESWDNARQSGEAIAHTLMGSPLIERRTPWFWSDQGNANIQLAGDLKASGRWIRRAAAGGGWLQLLVEEQRLHAAVGWNAGRENSAARRLIENKASVLMEKLERQEYALAQCVV